MLPESGSSRSSVSSCWPAVRHGRKWRCGRGTGRRRWRTDVQRRRRVESARRRGSRRALAIAKTFWPATRRLTCERNDGWGDAENDTATANATAARARTSGGYVSDSTANSTVTTARRGTPATSSAECRREYEPTQSMVRRPGTPLRGNNDVRRDRLTGRPRSAIDQPPGAPRPTADLLRAS